MHSRVVLCALMPAFALGGGPEPGPGMLGSWDVYIPWLYYGRGPGAQRGGAQRVISHVRFSLSSRVVREVCQHRGGHPILSSEL